jgi:peptidyl-prolyl cis-trans isomerase B (cyclophilin B)
MKRKILLLTLLVCATFVRAQTNYPVVVIETNYGTMKAILYDDTPVHSEHYLKLIKETIGYRGSLQCRN